MNKNCPVMGATIIMAIFLQPHRPSEWVTILAKTAEQLQNAYCNSHVSRSSIFHSLKDEISGSRPAVMKFCVDSL